MDEQQKLIQQTHQAEAAGDWEFANRLWAEAFERYPHDRTFMEAHGDYFVRLVKWAEEFRINATAEADAVGPPRVDPLLHPAYELRRDIAMARFTEQHIADMDSGEVRDQIVMVLADKEGIEFVENPGPIIQTDDGPLVVNVRYDSPPSLEDEWPRRDLERFHPATIVAVLLEDACQELHFVCSRILNGIADLEHVRSLRRRKVRGYRRYRRWERISQRRDKETHQPARARSRE